MNTKASLLKLFYALPVILLLGACNGDDNDRNSDIITVPDGPGTIADIVETNASFTTLATALKATGLDSALDDEEATLTVFAPTDAAFALLGTDTINALLADTDSLSNILLYHVVTGNAIDSMSAVAAAGSTLEMANGDFTGLSLNDANLFVNLSMVTVADIETDNGIIHVIDTVLIPPAARGEPTDNIVETAVSAGSFTTLVAALQAAGLDSTLADEDSTFTVFAPTDAAFAVLGENNIAALIADTGALTEVLLQHVIAGAEINSITAYTASGSSVETASGNNIDILISGGALTVGGATVTTTDIYASNGVIHVIDAVIVGDVELPAPPVSIVDVAVEAGSFTTLVSALQATGLDSTLADLDGTFTVFAPTDAAFAALGEGALDGLTNEELSNILLYHVIVGSSVLAQDAIDIAEADMSVVEMANGDSVGLSLSDSTLQINTAAVSSANVLADNGVIHVIDQVLLPPAEMGTPSNNIAEIVVADDNFETLLAALQAASLDSVLANEAESFTVFAPTDEAFAKIPSDLLSAIIADTDTLSAILLQHVVVGATVNSVSAFTLNGSEVETASGAMIGFDIVDGVLQVGGSNIVMYDIYANNGVIHVIDTVIVGDVELPNI